MEEKKLTDEEIAKAIEKCFAFPMKCEDGCPYFNKHGINFCVEDKAFYNDMKRIVQEHSEQKAENERLQSENERLTEENRQLVKIGNGFALERNNLQDKVHELTARNNALTYNSLEKARKIEKDTAKEILQWLVEHTFESCILETYFRERYGVEVE